MAMLMQTISTSKGGRRLRKYPADFDEQFVQLGRVGLEEHYSTGRRSINRWMEERGKARLIAERAAFVAKRMEERRNRLTRAELGRVLAQAFMVPGRKVSPRIARRAAHYLRSIRNGGWIISPTPDGDWFVGARRRSASDLIEMAKAKGFEANLRGDGNSAIDCAP